MHELIESNNKTTVFAMETRKLKLLILEDNETDAILIQRVLMRSDINFEAIVANDQNSFLSAIQNNTFDIILSDNYLPQFDATAAIELMRENKIDTPLILVTGTVSEGFAVSMIKTGACDYILKDRLQRLPSAILNAIERHQLKTKQKKDLEALVKSEACLKAIFDNTNAGYALLDTSLNVVLFNQAFYMFSTHQLEKPFETGKYAIDFFQTARQPFAAAMLEDALNGVSHRYEVTFRQQEGSCKVFDVCSYPVTDNDKKLSGVIISATDITNRKAIEF